LKVLIIDDDIPKLEELLAFMKDVNPSWTFSFKKSYQSGLKNIVLDTPVLVLLDMSMPTYDSSELDRKGGRPRPFAGLDILKEIRRKKLNCKVIVVTQYAVLKLNENDEKTLEEITNTMHRDFPTNFVGTVFYKYSEDSWQEPLKKLVEMALDRKDIIK
jgi:ActR/RegA family two-component response regulator